MPRALPRLPTPVAEQPTHSFAGEGKRRDDLLRPDDTDEAVTVVSRETRRPARPGAWRRRRAEPPPRERAGVVGCGGQGATAAKGEDRGGVGGCLREVEESATRQEKKEQQTGQDRRRCEKSWRRMANIPDQVDAALMAKLRLQSQSPGEKERRLGVGWACCEVLWRTVDGGRHDGGRRGGVAKSAHRFALSNSPPMDVHWCRASAQTVVWMRCWRSVPFLGQPMDGWEKGGGGRGCDGGVGLSAQRPRPLRSRLEGDREMWSVVGWRRRACQAARAVGRKHTRRSRRWMRMRQTREGPAAVRQELGRRVSSLSVDRSRTGWSVVVDRTLDENVEAVASNARCTDHLEV